MSAQKSAMKGVPITLQDAATTGNGVVLALSSGIKNHTVTIKGSAGVGAGAIQLEAATANDYTGTWAAIGGGPISVGNDTEQQITFTGMYQFIRARISTTVTGGTVTVEYVGS